MDEVHTTLTVCFEAPFWRGIFERTAAGTLCVCRITFGAEPKDQEVLELLQKDYFSLQFSPPAAAAVRQKADSPKRRQRAASREIRSSGIGTRSQQLLQAQREQAAVQRTKQAREKREERAERLFALRQKKRKDKHKGH